MIQAVFTIGIVLTVITVVLSVVLSRLSLKGYTLYYPFAALFLLGLIFLLFATILPERVMIAGAGLGGWGIASLFAAAIGLIVSAILDTYKHHGEEAS